MINNKEKGFMNSREELEKVIATALRKVEGAEENELCKFLPGPSGGYMHHFTLRKLKNSNPTELFKLLQEFIINSSSPKVLDPKPRAPRGSRRKRDVVSFSRTDIEKVLDLARRTGDQDLLTRFSPKRSLPTLKRELIRSIRENRVEAELWNAFAESIALINSPSFTDKL